jgi:hypothetical protein
VTGLLGCGVIGVAAGGLSAAMTGSVYFFEDVSQKHLRALHWMWWPALGGLAIGIGGWVAPRALGVGDDSIADLIAGRLALGTALVLINPGAGRTGGEAREALGEVTLEDVLTARRRHLEEETRRQRVLPLHALVGAWWRPGVKT